MQVTETSAEGLKREYRIIVTAGELEDKVTHRLDELRRSVQLPGFRPGRVPMQILRRRFGPAVLNEVLESTVQDGSADTIRDHNLRPALPPKVDIVSFSEGADLEYNMSIEVLPEIPPPDFAELGIERLAVDVSDEEVDRAVERIAEGQRKAEPVDRPAETGDILIVDVEGRVDGNEIPGAAGKDREIMLGSAGYLPGFEEQLIGAKPGEHRTVTAAFPADYGVADLAGKEAKFEVDVKEVRERQPAKIDDALAEEVGMENLAELRDEVKQRIVRDFASVARARLKRSLLDKLAERYDFPVPPGMIDLEFESIWRQHQAETGQEQPEAAEPAVAAEASETNEAEPVDGAAAAPAVEVPAAVEAGPTEGGAGEGEAAAPAADDEATKADYRRIAERRVRLGLLLAEVGRSNNITVNQEEISQAVAREARMRPGYERQVIEFYRQNQRALDSLQAPIFEDKVVDFIVEMAKLPERRVTPQELLALPGLDAEEEATPAA
jgi:trigger factor